MVKTRLTYANVVSTLSLFLALGGVSYAAITISNISVGSAQIKDGQVISADLSAGTRNALKGQAGAKGDKGHPGTNGTNGADGTTLPGWKVVNGYLIGKNASLSSADLNGSNLSGANLTGAILYNANLRGANLTGANLTGADLTYADLRAAKLSHTNLTDADLEHAIMPDGSIHP